MELWGKWLIFINIMKINPAYCDVQSIISVQLSARLDYAFICSTPCKLSLSLTQILYTVKRRLVYRNAHLVFLSFGIYASNLTLILNSKNTILSLFSNKNCEEGLVKATSMMRFLRVPTKYLQSTVNQFIFYESFIFAIFARKRNSQ